MISEAQGFVAPGFEPVAEEFERNFAEREELGAAFAAYGDGELVVDIWGGVADRPSGRLWAEDTLQVIFSGTKALVAVCLLMLIERGELERDAPLARYWPEFAAAGKDGVLVRDVVSHTAGLPGFRERLEIGDFVDDERLTALLAAQEPLLPPGEVLCYHGLTYGWLCGELVRRVDGRSVGRFFADEVAGPLDLELWIGLPEEFEERVATLDLALDWGSATALTAAEQGENELAALIWTNPPFFERERFPWNSHAYHAAEIPGAGAIGTARSIARLYACLALGGELDGVRILAEQTLRLGRTELSRGHESVLDAPMAFGIGFALQTELCQLGPPPDAFGHGGAGGSIHGAWPRERVGFSYAMNRMRDDQPVDPRAQALLNALHRAVGD